jgi:serine/threonine protein kinase
MANHVLKTGANSVLLGKNYYDGFFPHKVNKLLKVTKIGEGHDELKNLSYVRIIKNYRDYYIIPEVELTKILPGGEFMEYLKRITVKHSLDIFEGSLFCMYVDYGGQMDVMDSLMCFSPRVWKSCKAILRFSNQIMEGLSFLHEKKICHLDIKPENIMVNLFDNSFRIIDFGFSSVEPFDDFVHDIRGTPHYFPKHIELGSDLGLPRIKANDLDEMNGEIPMIRNRSLVYKIDSYCFGRVLNLVYDVYLDNTCCRFEKTSRRKIKALMELLLVNNVHRRLTISQILTLN